MVQPAMLFLLFLVFISTAYECTIHSDKEKCNILMSSGSARYTEEHVDQKMRDMAVRSLHGHGTPWWDTTFFREREYLLNMMLDDRYGDHICENTEFAPSVLKLQERVSCDEICRMCVPGSLPICFVRNPKYMGMGEACLCTYDIEQPITHAAFSLRHEKKIFSRRLRSN